MKPHRRLTFAAACSAGLVLAAIPANPAAAEIISVNPGAMYCNNGFVHVATPSLNLAGNLDGRDYYAPVIEYLAPGTDTWVPAAAGNVLVKPRITEYWVDENSTTHQPFHEFNISNPQKGHYWRVVQGVRDGETGRTWQVLAVLKNHDPDYCDATGYWD